MSPPPRSRARPEHAQTDASLAAERGKTDVELSRGAARLEEGADREVSEARDRADAVLAAARATADEKLRRAEADSDEWSTVREVRHTEDTTLAHERALADDSVSAGREARRRELATLLATEREQTDRHLHVERERADVAIESRDDFLAMASHDLRNMLAGIGMCAGSLTNLPCDAPVHEAILRDARRIQRYTAQMTRLVGDLVDVVSIEAGRLSVVPQRHDAAELLRDTLDVFQPIAAAKRIWIGSDIKQGSLLARYDHERILQVLANLIGNALKFTREGGRIHVQVEPVETEVRFAVTDTGAGIAPEKLGVIFERFWQIADKEKRSGLGLGLFISKCIIEAHGGRLWAESRAGEGSTFYFTLPAFAPASTREPSRT